MWSRWLVYGRQGTDLQAGEKGSGEKGWPGSLGLLMIRSKVNRDIRYDLGRMVRFMAMALAALVRAQTLL